eukprot:c40553_g1_i1 orf=54-224(-)
MHHLSVHGDTLDDMLDQHVDTAIFRAFFKVVVSHSRGSPSELSCMSIWAQVSDLNS